MSVITLPAAQVAAGAGHLPPVCPRHGEPATEHRSLTLISKPPAWALLFLLCGVIPYLIIALVVRKSVKAPAWPWCATCTAQRKKLFIIGLPLLLLGILLFVVGTVTERSDGLLVIPGLIVLFAGAIVTARGGAVPMTGALVSGDGQYVEVKKGSDRFLMALHQGRPPV